MEYKLTHNKLENRFEVHIDEYIALEKYKLFNGGISYIHTEVPEDFAVKGIGSFIAKGILDYAILNHLKVKPLCPFIKTYIDRHPEY